MTKKPNVFGGHFYYRMENGRMVRLPDGLGTAARADVWICRRVADYTRVPEGGALSACTRCDAPIVYNPARQIAAPKICMQCAAIQPLPIENP